jgi:hypothetical protein
MAQAIARDHHQVLQRISHHHLHILIKIKKSNQVFKRKNKILPVWENRMVRFPKTECPVLAKQKMS